MSVISSKLLAKNANLKVDVLQTRRYIHEFLIETDNDQDGPLVVYRHMNFVGPDPVPLLGAPYQLLAGTYFQDTGVYLVDYDIKRLENEEDNRNLWIVKCLWGPFDFGFPASEPPANDPLEDPIRYRLEWANYTRIIDYDVNGAPIVNGAGDKFDPPLTRDDVRPVLVAVRNMYPLQAVIDLALTFKNVINSFPFFGAPAYTAKVESITSGDLQQRNQYPFYAVTIRVQFIGLGTGTADPDKNWSVRLVDRGFQHMKHDNGRIVKQQAVKIRRKLDAVGNPLGDELDYRSYEEIRSELMTEPVNLYSDGFRIVPDTKPAQLTGTAWQIYPDLNFAALGIGGS